MLRESYIRFRSRIEHTTNNPTITIRATSKSTPPTGPPKQENNPTRNKRISRLIADKESYEKD